MAALASIAIVTGAPGSGKSSVARALLAQRSDFLVFDAGWLLDAASGLAGRRVAAEAALWPPYRLVWFTFLRSIAENGRRSVLFMPVEPRELPPPWHESVRWCLLDCDAVTRTLRLRERGWQPSTIEEAIADAVALRQQITEVIDTSQQEPMSVAVMIAGWLA